MKTFCSKIFRSLVLIKSRITALSSWNEKDFIIFKIKINAQQRGRQIIFQHFSNSLGSSGTLFDSSRQQTLLGYCFCKLPIIRVQYYENYKVILFSYFHDILLSWFCCQDLQVESLMIKCG